MTIGVHPTNDVMLSFGIVNGFFSISVFATSIFTNQEKTMNNTSSTIVFIDQENAFVQLPNTSGPIINLEDTL